jgi:outer membrane protein
MAAAVARSARKQLPEIRESLELECVAGRIQDEERGLLPRESLEAHARLYDPLDLAAAQARGQFLPLQERQHYPAVRYRHAVPVNRIEQRRYTPVCTEARVQVADELVSVHVEIDPVGGAASLGTPERHAVETARFRNVPDLDGYVKRRKSHKVPRSLSAPRGPASIAAARPAPRLRRPALAALTCLVAAPGARADSGFTDPPATFLSAGPAVMVTPSYPGAKTQRTFALPDLEGQYHNWLYISGTDLVGVYAYNRQGNKAGAAIAYDFTERLQNDSRQLGPLKDVEPTPRLKLFIEQRVAMFVGGLRAATDIGGHDEGTVAQAYVNLLLPLTAHGFVTLGPGLTWSDRHYMNAFYSVTAEQSEISGLPQYQAHPGISDLYGEVLAGYELSSRWALALDVTYARLHGDAADSPFTLARAQTTWFASVLYKVR